MPFEIGWEDKSFTVGSCIREFLPNTEKHVMAKIVIREFLPNRKTRDV
jgi:hypothetical protein